MAQKTQPAAAAGIVVQTSVGAHTFVWIEKTNGDIIGALQLSGHFAPVISADGLRARVDSASAATLARAGCRQSANQAGLVQTSVAANVETNTPFGVTSFVWFEPTAGGPIGTPTLTSGFAPLISGDGLRARLDLPAVTPAALAAAAYRVSINQGG